MNPKEKDELRELKDNLLFAIKASRYPYPLSKSQIEVVLEAFEHPQPLDAGKVEVLLNVVSNDELAYPEFSIGNQSFTLNPVEGYKKDGVTGEEMTPHDHAQWYCDQLKTALNKFAQASITAKQKEWEEEKADLLESINELARAGHRSINKTANPNFNEKAREARKELAELHGELISKHTNNIKTNEKT